MKHSINNLKSYFLTNKYIRMLVYLNVFLVCLLILFFVVFVYKYIQNLEVINDLNTQALKAFEEKLQRITVREDEDLKALASERASLQNKLNSLENLLAEDTLEQRNTRALLIGLAAIAITSTISIVCFFVAKALSGH